MHWFLRILAYYTFLKVALCGDKSDKMSKLLKRIDESQAKKEAFQEEFDTK